MKRVVLNLLTGALFVSVVSCCFGCRSAGSADVPIVIMDFLYIFPNDLGQYEDEPKDIINGINEQNIYGYNDWRLPTIEELQFMCANMPVKLTNVYMSSSFKTVTIEEDTSPERDIRQGAGIRPVIISRPDGGSHTITFNQDGTVRSIVTNRADGTSENITFPESEIIPERVIRPVVRLRAGYGLEIISINQDGTARTVVLNPDGTLNSQSVETAAFSNQNNDVVTAVEPIAEVRVHFCMEDCTSFTSSEEVYVRLVRTGNK